MNVDPLQVLSKLAAVYNIPACRVTPPFAGLENFDYGLRKALDPEFDWQEFGYTLLKHTPEQTLLIAEGTFELKFALFRVPDEKDTVFMIGPWTDGPRSEDSRRWRRKISVKPGTKLCRNTTTASTLFPAMTLPPPSTPWCLLCWGRRNCAHRK